MLHLLRDRIQVLPSPMRENITSAGILVKSSHGIVESQKQFGREGEVVAVGVDVHELQVGDRVIWGEFDFPKYEEGGKTYLVLQEADICAVLESV